MYNIYFNTKNSMGVNCLHFCRLYISYVGPYKNDYHEIIRLPSSETLAQVQHLRPA